MDLFLGFWKPFHFQINLGHGWQVHAQSCCSDLNPLQGPVFDLHTGTLILDAHQVNEVMLNEVDDHLEQIFFASSEIDILNYWNNKKCTYVDLSIKILLGVIMSQSNVRKNIGNR